MAELDLLVEEVGKNWRERRVLLMAQVKRLLAEGGNDVEALLDGRQVKAWLESDVPVIKLIKNEREPTNWGLVPADADVPEPHSQYFVKARKQIPKTDFPFQNALRIAFTRPIDAERRRWIFAGPPRFLDLPLADKPDGGTELTSAGIEPGAADERVVALIKHWLEQNGLDADDFLYDRASSAPRPRGPRSALHQLLGLIPAEDLARVSLPLDLVCKLLEKPEEGPR